MTDQKHVEIEAKIKVKDLAEIERKLKAAGAMLHAERVYERNVRYEDAAESLTPAARVLRLRQDTRARLTYKEPHDAAGQGEWARTELEVTVSDFDTTDLLLKKLGFTADVAENGLEALEALSPVERWIVESHYGIGTEALTLREIGAELGLTAPRIGQIEARALERLGSELAPLRRAV